MRNLRPLAMKTFDCVEMMHQGAAAVRRELEGKSLEEQMSYWREGTAALLKRQAQLSTTTLKDMVTLSDF
jgi:hypothetical protein